MTIDELVFESHQTAVDKGWWDEKRNLGELIALMHSELSEALEEYRKKNEEDWHLQYDEKGKPVGFVVELADVVIRIADLCGRFNLDLDDAITEKMAYNKTRSYRHGGKRA